MYVTAPNEVFALDARTGRQIWQYRRPRTHGRDWRRRRGRQPRRGDARRPPVHGHRRCAHPRAASRQRPGAVGRAMADYRQHYGATSAPLVVGDLVDLRRVGRRRGHSRLSSRPSTSATGREVWRFWTVPARGEPGCRDLAGQGARARLRRHLADRLVRRRRSTPAATGRRATRVPTTTATSASATTCGRTRSSRSTRRPAACAGTSSSRRTISTTGMRCRPSLPSTRRSGARPRKLLLQANRNGFFYVLDRETGQLLLAKPFISNLNWATGVGANGRPQRVAGMEPSWRGTTVCPSVEGATNWMSPAFNPDTGLYYVMALERCSVFQKSSRWFEQGESFYGGSTRNVPGESAARCCGRSTSTPAASPGRCRRSARATPGAACSRRRRARPLRRRRRAFSAVDARTGKRLWQFPANARGADRR